MGFKISYWVRQRIGQLRFKLYHWRRGTVCPYVAHVLLPRWGYKPTTIVRASVLGLTVHVFDEEYCTGCGRYVRRFEEIKADENADLWLHNYVTRPGYYTVATGSSQLKPSEAWHLTRKKAGLLKYNPLRGLGQWELWNGKGTYSER